MLYENAKTEGFKEPLVYQITRKEGKRTWLRDMSWMQKAIF